MAFPALVVFGYLLGSCPWGYWLVRLFRHEDIRTVGELRAELEDGQALTRHTELREWLAA